MALLLLSIGPLGFYNLWKSPNFSKKAKTFITSLVVILTITMTVGLEAVYQMFLCILENRLASPF